VLRLVLTAVALGLSNFAASIGIGVSGADANLRVRVAVVFGAFEAAMPVVGLVLGHRLAASIGTVSSYLGGGLLIAVGLYSVVQARRASASPTTVHDGLITLVVTGAALSIDNLVVGFALGTQTVPVALSAAVIASVSVAMSLLGLELGQRLGRTVEQRSQEIGGAMLVLVGAGIAVGPF
jgi:putative Mn2+ efflux pump MntP